MINILLPLSLLFSVSILAMPLYSSGFMHATDKQFHRNVFDGKELVVLAYHYPPMFTYKKMKDGSYQLGGFFKDLLEDSRGYYNFDIKYTVLDPVKVAKYGIWEAILEPLDKKEADIVPFLFVQDLYYLKHMELSAAIWIDPLRIMQPWPKEESRLKVTARPFQLAVWVCLIGSIISFVLVATFFIRQIKFDEAKSNIVFSTTGTMLSQCEYVLKIITSQGYYIPYGTRTSLKLLIGIWIVCNIVLINAYAGVLTSLLTVPKLEPIANTVEDVAKSDVLRVTIETNLGLAEIFLNATQGYEKTIGDRFREDPTLFTTDAFSSIKNVVHRQCAYLGDSSIIGFIIREDTKAYGYCRMTSSHELIDYHSNILQIGFPIGSPYASTFDEFTLRMWSCGIVSFYKNRYFPSTDQCRTDAPPITKTRPLKLVDLVPAFFIFVVGISFSISTFIIEVLIGFLKNKLLN